MVVGDEKKGDARTDLAPVVDEGKLGVVTRPFDNICDLGRYPSLFFIREPDPGSLAINVLCHGPGGCRRCEALIACSRFQELITGLSHGHLIISST